MMGKGERADLDRVEVVETERRQRGEGGVNADPSWRHHAFFPVWNRMRLALKPSVILVSGPLQSTAIIRVRSFIIQVTLKCIWWALTNDGQTLLPV